MSSARRLARALMAVSTFLRAPWGVSLAVKATINARPRPPGASTWSGYHRSSSCGGRGVTAVRQRAVATGSGEAAVLSEPVDVRVEDASKSAAEGVEVSQREVLSREAWMARAEAHRKRVRSLTNGSVHHDKSDPIFNFLFEYYHFKPRMLLQWTPGFDAYLLDADPSLKGCPLPQKAWESGPGAGGSYNPFGLDNNRRVQVQWMRDLLQATTSRAPVLHCFGLHEWAMLYRPRGAEEAGIDARSVHQTLPLRVSQDEINAMVEGRGGALACTHFDAFRFFTPEAKPLNPVQLERVGQRSNDQPGCVHANMDLFKWALRLWPLLPSEKLANALELAVSCRMLDMRASPYDLTAHGKVPDTVVGRGGGRVGGLPPEAWDPTPVRIETEEGRKEYQQAQAELYQRSMPVRRSLMRHMDRLLDVWGR
ncbi:conserved unknown protein [Ectocarpus siliculosus]|uniref:3-methyladenine DNA glycosylase n=1 Tax=Ectocarpus siliculosus TaxID=2880 RepID=D8LQE5_ECTSI|nr:conserved unknown protein [Ectocarpus siliculosus]|eukprot:CBN78709.1 conserved unknown protein [Ectocarpus siliculosus]